MRIYELYKKHEEIINYLIIGGMTTLLSLVTYYLLSSFIFSPDNPLELQICNIISWIVGFIFAFITNKTIVFKSKEKKFIKEFLSFFLARISTLFIDMFIMFLFVTVLGLNDKVFKIISQIIVIILNYIFSKLFVFKK